jgi:hypothetical protein
VRLGEGGVDPGGEVRPEHLERALEEGVPIGHEVRDHRGGRAERGGHAAERDRVQPLVGHDAEDRLRDLLQAGGFVDVARHVAA